MSSRCGCGNSDMRRVRQAPVIIIEEYTVSRRMYLEDNQPLRRSRSSSMMNDNSIEYVPRNRSAISSPSSSMMLPSSSMISRSRSTGSFRHEEPKNVSSTRIILPSPSQRSFSSSFDNFKPSATSSYTNTTYRSCC